MLLLLLACTTEKPPPVTEDDSGVVDTDGDGSPFEEDCDDADPGVHAGAPETCDGVDQDCDGVADEEATDASAWYADTDADGYGDGTSAVQSCTRPVGYVSDATDCDDGEVSTYPGAAEWCDGADQDCDGVADDEAVDATEWFVDGDGDGFGDAPGSTACSPGEGEAFGGDCDDADAAISPAGVEVCDGLDQDCDGAIDEEDVATEPWYTDVDGDGYGDPATASWACAQTAGATQDGSDCDDADVDIHPDASERCDGRDEDCDGTIDEDALDAATWFADADGDGFGDPSSSTLACDAPLAHVADGTDCDDADAEVAPGVAETCDGVDQDCNGAIDDGDVATEASYTDADGDGFGDPATASYACTTGVADGSDCDDSDSAVYPGASDECDGLDNDCDGAVDDATETASLLAGWPAAARAEGTSDRVQLSDLDGDGLLDTVACGDSLTWMLGDGGTWIEDGFVSPWESLDVGGCDALALADIDGDGDDDAVVASSDGAVAWYTNEVGDFSTGTSLGVTLTGGLAVGDFDGDGLVDIAADPYVLWNDGGSFTVDSPFPCTTSQHLALPLVEDGRSVLACVGDGAAWLADASRSWSAVTVDAACFDPAQSASTVGDLDGDGFVDSLVSGASVAWCAGDGTGALTWVETLYDGGGDDVVADLADADGDGWLDFAVRSVDDGSGDLHLFRGGAGGPAAFADLSLPDELRDGGAAWRDLDGDGLDELLAWGEGAWYQLPPDGDAFATPWVGDLESSEELEATTADLDGDGLADLVAFGETGAWVYRNLGDREFATAEAVTLTSTSPTPWPGGVDLDGDGDEETWEMGSWTRVAWDGAATAAVEPTPPDLYTRYAQAHAADLDGDGDAELLVENATRDASDLGGEALALGGVGETGWPTSWTDLVDTVGADVVRAVAMDGDLTGDGPADLVLVDAAGVRVWAWDGAAFAEVASTDLAWAATAPDTTVRRWLAESDDDGDGDIDLLLGLNGEEAAQVFLNDGAGSFRLGERVSVPASLADSTANVEDLDGDGRLEAWSVADDLQGWRDGASGWEALDTSYVAFGPYAAARDLDGDGAADVVGASGDRVYVVWGTREDVVLTCE